MKSPAILPPRLFPPTAYYVLMAARGAVIDTSVRYNKADKGVHRFTIADTRGTLRLTVPVSRPSGCRLWRQATVSDHGRWWETMPVALESAYGRTPFFEYYIDRFRPLFSPEPEGIVDVCLRADALVRGILDLPAPLTAGTPDPTGAPDCRTADFEALSMPLPPYWQVRADTLGFIPGLSVLDLLFNLGPEACLYIDRAAEKI